MWKLALFVSLALLVSADWSVEQSSFLRPLSVDPEECDYLTEVCGPITSVDFFELQDKKFAFVGTGSGIQVLDVTNPLAIEEVDSENLCQGSRGVRVSPGDGVVNVWSYGSGEFCECHDESCHVFQVEVNGKLYDARESDFSSLRFSETPITGNVVLSEPVDGCFPFTNVDDVAGNIVLIERGSCSFDEKAQNALDAGAIAVLVGNIFYNDPFSSLLTMTGDAIPIPAAMVTKFAYEEIAAEIASGPVTATLSTLIGADITDDRFVPYQGLTLMTFDGTKLSEPTFYTDLFDTDMYQYFSFSELWNDKWLLVQASLKSDPGTHTLKLLFDITNGLEQVASLEDGKLIENGFLMPDGDGGADFWVYAANPSESEISVWMVNEPAEFDDEATVTEIAGYNTPYWDVAEYNGEDFIYVADGTFGGGVQVVDSTYFPDWYNSRVFYPPNNLYDQTANDNVLLGTEKVVLSVGSSAEGISFWNVTETPYAPKFLASFDTMPDRENDWTVYNWVIPYSDFNWLVLTSHDGINYLQLTEEDTSCPVCEVCQDEQRGEIGTQINFSFAGLMNKK